MRQLKIIRSITNREEASLDKYLQEIGLIPMISQDEEIILVKRIHQGDEVALEKLIKANLRFVVSVAKQYQNQGLSLPDLINEGNFGLIKAAKRFDESRGFKFISYAVWWIRQTILQAINEQARIVRLPINKLGSIDRINKLFSEFEQTEQREPLLEEIVQRLEISETEAVIAKENSEKHTSLDVPFFDSDGETTLSNNIKSEESYNPDTDLILNSLKEDIKRSLSKLSFKESKILEFYYGLNGLKTLSVIEIANKLEIHPEYIRQIRRRAIGRLRKSGTKKLLHKYL